MARLELLDQIAVKACNAYSNLTLEERPTLFLEFHSTQSGNTWILLLFRKNSKRCIEIFKNSDRNSIEKADECLFYLKRLKKFSTYSMYNPEIGLEYQTSTVNEISKDFGGSDFDFAIQQEDRNKLWTARYDFHFYKYTQLYKFTHAPWY